MNMRKKILILGVMAVAAAAWAVPAFAARPIQGAVGEVSAADGPALGSVGFRVWSAMPGGETNVNDNVVSCRNVRCIRTFTTLAALAAPGAAGGGGYVGNQEGTGAYNADAAEQPFYMLADADMNAGGGNHICYWGVSGVVTNNSGVGGFLPDDCGVAGAQNCFGRIDADFAGPILNNAKHGYGGGPGQIRAVGGLNPVPNVEVGGVAGGLASLSWAALPDYTANMRPSTASGAAPSPVAGVRLYKIDRTPCTDPNSSDTWDPLGDFGPGAGGTTDNVAAAPGDCRYYALGVRFVGPGGAPNEVETFCKGVNSQPVSTDATAVRITRFDVNYVGQGVVNVNWTSGTEGDAQGYYVTRGLTSNGPYTRVSNLVRARGDNMNYTHADRVKAGTSRVYYYQLDIVGRDGTTTSTAPAVVTLPGRTRKGNPSLK